MAIGNKLSDVLGTTEQGYKLDGSNKIEFHPIFQYEPGGAASPDNGGTRPMSTTPTATILPVPTLLYTSRTTPRQFA